MENQTSSQKIYQDFLELFESKSVHELMSYFNKEVGCKGWTSARGAYLRALRVSIEKISQKENIELDETVFMKNGTSYNRQIELKGNRLS